MSTIKDLHAEPPAVLAVAPPAVLHAEMGRHISRAGQPGLQWRRYRLRYNGDTSFRSSGDMAPPPPTNVSTLKRKRYSSPLRGYYDLPPHSASHGPTPTSPSASRGASRGASHGGASHGAGASTPMLSGPAIAWRSHRMSAPDGASDASHGSTPMLLAAGRHSQPSRI